MKSAVYTRNITSRAEFENLQLADDSPRPVCVYKRTRLSDPELIEPEVRWIIGYRAELDPEQPIVPKKEVAALVFLSDDLLRKTMLPDQRVTYDDIRQAKDGSRIQVRSNVKFDFQRVAVPTGLARFALPSG